MCYCRGQTPTESEENFLKIVAKLDTYGVDPHCVKVTALILHSLLCRTKLGSFLPRDASAERGYEIACRPSVCL